MRLTHLADRNNLLWRLRLRFLRRAWTVVTSDLLPLILRRVDVDVIPGQVTHPMRRRRLLFLRRRGRRDRSGLLVVDSDPRSAAIGRLLRRRRHIRSVQRANLRPLVLVVDRVLGRLTLERAVLILIGEAFLNSRKDLPVEFPFPQPAWIGRAIYCARRCAQQSAAT